jgi:hypothetical protein
MNLHATYVGQWNLSIQRQVATNWLVSASLLGNNTVHSWSSRALDPAIYIPGNCAAGQYGLAVPAPVQQRVMYLRAAF